MSVVDRSKITKARYGYNLKVFVGSSGKTIVEGKDVFRIRSFRKIDDPIMKDLLFPKVELEVVVDSDQRKLIQKNRSDIIVLLSMNVRNEYVGPTNMITVMSDRVLWEHKFQAVIAQQDDTNLESEDNPSFKENPEGIKSAPSADMAPKYSTVKMTVSVIEHRNQMKKVVNFNNSSASSDPVATVAGTFAAAMLKIGCKPKSVIFQQPDRTTTFKQIPVPIWNFKDFSKYMQTVFGVYKTGLIVYRDLDYLYVIPNASKDYAIPDNTFNQIHIYQESASFAGSVPQGSGMYEDKDASRYVISQSKTYRFINMEDFMKETAGNKFKIFSPESAEKSLTSEGGSYSWTSPFADMDSGLKGNINSDDKIRYFNNELSNEYLQEELTFKLKLSTEMLTLSVSDVDFSILTYNKTYKVIFNDDPKIEAQKGGFYKLLYIEHNISANNAEPLSSMSNLLLVKLP